MSAAKLLAVKTKHHQAWESHLFLLRSPPEVLSDHMNYTSLFSLQNFGCSSKQWINKCSLPDGMYRAWRLWQSIGCKTFQIEYTVTLVSFTVVHQKERWGFKTDLTLWRRTCSLSGTVFTIFYRGWQEHGWWKCQHWLLLSVKHMALAWQSSLERHCCTEMWRKVKRSAALPNNPRHNMVWMTAARKHTVTKMQK